MNITNIQCIISQSRRLK